MEMGSWQVEAQYKNIFQAGAARFYGMLHSVLTARTSLEITPQQVRRRANCGWEDDDDLTGMRSCAGLLVRTGGRGGGVHRPRH